jgi:anti-sigma regulatory factor (Ser/Thr protein kinase)
MKIHLPNSAFLGNIDAFLKKYNNVDPNTLEISANEKWISIHPIVLSMITALGLTMEHKNIKCDPIKARSKPYLIRMGLFKFLGVDAGVSIEEHEAAGRFIPLTQIQTSGELSKFITDMIPLLHVSPEQAKIIGYIVSELVRNVIEHAQAEHGAILCAQYYKKSNSIRIGIADTGVGIKATITQSHPANTDLDALRLALSPGVTGTTKKEGGTAENAGAGLFFIKSIASVNRDFFVIYSGNGFYKLLRTAPAQRLRLHADPFEDRHSENNGFPYWKGTLIGVDITLDQTQEFSHLLQAIRETYIKDTKERRKARFKRPLFVE